MEFDVFISHASEDKKDFVRQLAKKLEEHQVVVWYDEFTLKPGNSLRRSIDLGLSKCRLGIVVLSDNFFKKKWTAWELDGLVARQNASENELIIPIWLNITRDQLLEYSPPLADKVAIQASEGIDEVVAKLLQVIKPEGSTLVIARDLLFKEGLTPPLVTDDFWLDVVEYSGKEYLHHEYLSFSIPWEGWEPKNRGEYIARHALQKNWQEEGEEILISQLTPPNEVLEFIDSQPGLKEVALNQPKKIAFFFPQLAIKDFGGFLEPSFDNLLKQNPKYSTRHTCEEEVALRHPDFGNYSYIELADFYFTGAGGGIGPPTARHDYIDFIIWLLSSDSSWLPEKIRYALLEGMKQWAVWQWNGHSNNYSDFKGTENSEALEDALYKAKKPENFKLTKKIILDIKERIDHSRTRLNLSDSLEELYASFIKANVIEAYISKKLEREARRR